MPSFDTDSGAEPRPGRFVDWLTQVWVRAARVSVDVSVDGWLDGPTGRPDRIGVDYFADLAQRENLVERLGPRPMGLLESFEEICSPDLAAHEVHPEVRRFYEETSSYTLDLWSEWNGFFRPFGRLLAMIFSRRLQQLNIPLSSLDSSRGMHSRVVHLEDPSTGQVVHTGWVRTNTRSGETVYVGAYSACRIPNQANPCVKVMFPLPNGAACVLMSARADPEKALVLESFGATFGDPGFYLVVCEEGTKRSVRYLRTFRERIRVFVDEQGELRTDHEFTLWGLSFL